MSLQDRIQKAKTKDELEQIGEEIGVNVDKRRGVETIRADLMVQAEEVGGDEGDSNTEEKLEQEKAIAPDEPTKEEENVPEDDDAPVHDAAPDVLVTFEDEKQAEKEDDRKPVKAKGRLIKNTKTGRTLSWSPKLAKLKHMKEV